jgi:hypothetical protein
MIASTTDRVPRHTDPDVNREIRLTTKDNIACYAAAGRPAINRRLAELDEEWDIERAIEANAATAVLIGLTLGATVDRRWYALPAAVAGFLLQHALQGWCPPIPVLRRMGIRTAGEIDEERQALKALRGDFAAITSTSDVDSVIEAVQR